jgi:peptidyl-prolyl cis-trans isomerase D
MGAGVAPDPWSLTPDLLVYNRREQRISVGEVRPPHGPLVTPSQPAVSAHPEGRQPLMIRFLQSKDNRLVKAIFIVIIGAAVITMVVTLIPGIFQMRRRDRRYLRHGLSALVQPLHLHRRKVSMTRVQEIAQQQLQRQRLPDFALPYMVQRVGQQLILQKVLLAKASSLGISANDEDVRNFLHTGQYGELLFPNGQFIGEDKYRQFISSSVRHDHRRF